MARKISIFFILFIFTLQIQRAHANTITFDNHVLSFEHLNSVNTSEELNKFGLTGPEQTNHKAGTNLILLAIRSTSYGKGTWASAIGLLGSNMIEASVVDRIGYESLFSSSQTTSGCKLSANLSRRDNYMLLDINSGISNKISSIISKREAAIFALAFELECRYYFNNKGNYQISAKSDPNRESNTKLAKNIKLAISILNKLSERGFNDITLKNCIGIATASLYYDQQSISEHIPFIEAPLQVYLDALKPVIAELSNRPEKRTEFIHDVCIEMDLRGLRCHDEILLPSTQKNLESIVNIISTDLSKIELKHK